MAELVSNKTVYDLGDLSEIVFFLISLILFYQFWPSHVTLLQVLQSIYKRTWGLINTAFK